MCHATALDQACNHKFHHADIVKISAFIRNLLFQVLQPFCSYSNLSGAVHILMHSLCHINLGWFSSAVLYWVLFAHFSPSPLFSRKMWSSSTSRILYSTWERHTHREHWWETNPDNNSFSFFLFFLCCSLVGKLSQNVTPVWVFP